MFTNGRLELLTKCRENMRGGQEQPLLGKWREAMQCLSARLEFAIVVKPIEFGPRPCLFFSTAARIIAEPWSESECKARRLQ